MRCLVVDSDAIGLDLVLRASAAGHEVRWFRQARYPIRDGEGMKGFQVIDDWQVSMPWAKDGLIIATHNGRYVHDFDRYRELGYKIFAPTVKSAELEINRSAGMKAMQAVGIDIPPYETFNSLEDAEKFARKSDRAWVFKPMGDEQKKALTYVSHDPADLVGWLRRQIKSGTQLKGQCMLQEKVDMLAEIGVSGWCGPDGFLPDKYQSCYEHKKLMNDELGPNTGEMGTLTQYCEEDKLFDEMLKPMEPVLMALGHRGDFAIGAMIDTKGKAYPLEFTARLGWPCFFIQMASHRGDPIKWMRDLLDGKDTLRVSYDPAIGVVMTQPPFPNNVGPVESVVGNPIEGIEEIGDQAHLVSVMKGRGPKMVDGQVREGDVFLTTDSYVMCVTGLGKTIEKARDKVYGGVDKVRFADRQYRTDIGCKVADKLAALHKHGYALDLRA